MSGITIQAIKPTPESKVGISFTSRQGAIIINSITDTSIFASSALRIGHEIATINGTNVSGMSADDVRVLLQAAPKTVALKIRLPSTLWTFSYEKSVTSINKATSRVGASGFVKTNYTCNSDRSSVPLNLSITGVSAKSWAKIVDVCNNELLPAIKASDQLDTLLAKQMKTYVGNQMIKGYIGFGLESDHEKKVLDMIHEAAILNNNASLMTSKVVALANALLNKHNVMVQPSFAATDKSLKTNGLTFVLMDE